VRESLSGFLVKLMKRNLNLFEITQLNFSQMNIKPLDTFESKTFSRINENDLGIKEQCTRRTRTLMQLSKLQIVMLTSVE